MKGRILELSRRLVIEERFIAIKNLPRFIRRTGGSATEGKRYIDRQIFFGYNVSVAAMIAFSALLTVTQVRLPYHLAHIQTLSLVLYSYIFLISLYSFLMHANVVISYKLMEPLKLLPTDMEDSVLPLSWFIFTGSPSLFVIIPPPNCVYMVYRQYLFCLLWHYLGIHNAGPWLFSRKCHGVCA